MIKAAKGVYVSVKLIYNIVSILGRFFLGRNGVFSGERKTDATFLRPATRSLDPSGTALRWEMMPGWRRLLLRLSGLYLLLLSGVLLLLWAASSVFSLPWYLRPLPLLAVHGGILLSLLGVKLGRRRIRRHGYSFSYPVREIAAEHSTESGEIVQEKTWRWERVTKEGTLLWEKEKILPVAGAASSVLGVAWPLEKEKLRAVSIPRDYRDGGAIVISLPPSFSGVTPKVEGNLETALRNKLGVRELSSSWQLEGDTPRVVLRVPAELPDLISFSDAQLFLESAEEFNPFYGVTASGEGLSISMSGDSPHTAVSAGSGAGKSEMIKVRAMQALRWGWHVIVLDWKEESQEWIKGLPGVRYISDIESIHNMGEILGEEVEARKAAGKSADKPNILVICEEWSLTADLLQDYWTALRSTAETEEKKLMPTRSPALTGFKKIIYTGRALGMFEMLVAIRFSARVTGGNADLRESFQVILMARYKTQTVKMLAGNIKPFPRNAPKERGRWVAVMGDEAVVYRAPLVTDEEAREFATSGVSPSVSPFVERYNLSRSERPNTNVTLGDHAGSGLAGPSREDAQAIEGEAVEIRPKDLRSMLNELMDVDESITLEILRKAAKNPEESGFPEVLGRGAQGAYLYDPQSVRMWTRKRYAVKVTRP